MKTRQVRLGAMAAIAIVLLSALFLLSHASDPGAHARIVGELRGIREDEEALGRLVLETSTRRLLTYDPILSTEQNLEQSLARVRSDPAMQSETEAKLLEHYAALVKDRRALLEHFEAVDAVYHNSSLSLPLLTHEISNRLRLAGQQEIADGIAEWDQTLFLRLHGRGTDDDLTSAAERLKALAAGRPEAEHDIELLLTHAQVLVRGQETTADLMGRILELSRGPEMSEIYRVYMEGHVAADRRAGRVLYGLYTVTFLCALSLLVLVVKLDQTSDQLTGTNRLLIERAGELERLSVALQGEIEERTTVQEALEEHMDGLERKVAERTVALVASEARLVDAIETLPEAFVLFDAEDRLVVCNTAYRTLFSLTKHETQKNITFGEIKRRAFRRGLFADDAGNTEPEWQDSSVDPHSVGNKVRRTEVRLADGRWIEVQERRTLDAGFVSLQIDVTETRLRDEALAERNKLTALGQLAGGVAHEINNLLQPALIFPELVRDRLPPDDLDSREELDIVLDSVRKAREIVRNILLFSRKQEPTLETVDLAAETATAVKFVRDLLPAGILLQHHIDASPAMAAVNRTQLAQVLTNLVLNAVHAMDSRGAITVRLGQTRPSASQAEALAIGADANYLTLTVADTGTGMDSAVVARIFEPFFTTKPLGEGTGLGLSVVFGILRSWQGAIAVESKLGTGTAFTLYIPMVDPTPAAQLAPSVAA